MQTTSRKKRISPILQNVNTYIYRAVAGKLRYLLQSFFFLFVVYSHHQNLKYLGKEFNPGIVPVIIFSSTLPQSKIHG